MFWPQRMSSAEMGLLRDFPGGPMVKTPYFSAQNKGLIPGQGTKIPHATWCGQKKNTHTHTHIQRWVSFIPVFLKAAILLSWWMG